MSRGGRPREQPIRQRTCLGCRSVRAQSEMTRLTVDARGLVADARGRLCGRGAYVCVSETCVRRACRHLSKALRLASPPPAPDELWDLVTGRTEALGSVRHADEPEAGGDGGLPGAGG